MKECIKVGLLGAGTVGSGVYKLAKEMHMKDIAEKYKVIIDNKAYNALMSYEVNIND